MRFSDLLATSFSSLRQRPFRTLMTVLGVVIGTTSVVVMVSLGIGMSQSYLDSIAANTSLREVQIYNVPVDAVERGLPTALNDDFVALMKDYPGVEKAWPIYSIEALGRVGAFSQYFQINAVPADVIASLDQPIAWGSAPSAANPGLLVGDQIPLNFFNETTGEVKQVDFSTETLFLDFDTSSMYGPVPQGGGEGEGDEGQAPKPKKIIMPVAGVLQGDPDQPWGQYTNVVYAEFSAMVEALEKAMPGKALPNQPATSDGKPKPGFVYSMIRLQTPSPEAAEELLTALRTDGYDAQADIEWIREAQKQGALIQAVFGGIGLVSLLVAAIGIANTMMMSVYERTREIGVMKVLGAGLGDIRKMFLFESASIGLLGGLLGLGLSMVGSAIANAFLGGAMGGTGAISIIPPWLMIGAVAFATLIGTVAGLAPAIRASRLSPLAAIRTQ